MSVDGCPGDDELNRWLSGQVAPTIAAGLEAHVDRCAACTELLVELGQLTEAGTPASDDETPPRIGRFTLRELLGAGAMGVVYRAADPVLGRDVAVKLVRPIADAERRDRRDTRLLREARALAALRHPGVVVVHDAGRGPHGTWIAMELLQGRTAQAWLREERPGWRRVIQLYASAGRGLAEAHARGIVHRDVKPANVFVESTGRVVLADFGLAGARDAPPPDGAAEVSVSGAGTPAYCAPEVLGGDAATPASDQYSLCAALFEGIYGHRPFSGRDVTELRAAATAGLARRPAGPVPRAVFEVLRTGLAPAPADRYPSVEALLEALQAAARPRWPRRLALAAVLMLGVTATWGLHADTPGVHCDGGADAVAAVWSAETRTRARSAVLGAGGEYADEAWRTIDARLDEYLAGWRRAHRDACLATWARGEQSPALLDRRMACLQRRLDGVRAYAAQLATTAPLPLDRAVSAASALSPLSDCTAEAVLAASSPPRSGESAALERTLEDIQAAAHLGEAAAQLPAARRIEARTRELGDTGLAARARLVLGLLERDAGRPADAVPTLHTAAATADEADLPEVRGQAWLAVAQILALERHAFEDARLWLEYARRLAARLDLAGLDRRVLELEGLIASRRGDLPGAVARYRAALARTAAEPADRARSARANLLNSLAVSYLRAGDYQRAHQAAGDGLALETAHKGPSHPDVAKLRMARGMALVHLDRLEEGCDELRGALQAYEVHAGHAGIAVARYELGRCLGRRGRIDDALEHLAAAEVAFAARHGGASPKVLAAREARGLVLARAGRHRQALEIHAQATALAEQTLEPDDPQLANLLSNQAYAALEAGEPERATQLLRRAREIYRRTYGDDHVRMAYVRAGLGRAALRLGRATEAHRQLRDAQAILKRQPGERELAASIALDLARVLWLRGEREAAMAEARSARAGFAALGDQAATAHVDDWLAARDRRAAVTGAASESSGSR